MNKMLTVSHSPHVHSGMSTQKLMSHVLIALIPAFAVSVWMFGWGAVIVTAVAVASSMLFEYLIAKFLLKQESSITDGSAALTGVLLAFTLPVNIPLWLVVLGSLVAIGVGKMTFGGLGNNPFNPALVGRVFLFISFPVQMTSWPVPNGFSTLIPKFLSSHPKEVLDANTGATALGSVKEGMMLGGNMDKLIADLPSNIEMFYGKMGGSLGEIAALALLIGFAYLLITKVITWHIPVTVIATVAIFSGILWFAAPEANASPVFHLVTGGLMLGAIFMATDYVTSPMTKGGMIIFAVGIGVLTVLIRRFGAYPEGVQFAILIMNAFVPLINTYMKPKRFGKLNNK